MSTDARFEDAAPGGEGGADRPLRLRAWDVEDLQVLSALAQDAVFPAREMRWQPRKRRFAILLNRFRWEESAPRRAPQRVQAVLAVEDVAAVRSRKLPTDRQATDSEAVLSLLGLHWQPGAEGAGVLTLTLAGGATLALDCEALEVTLTDVTRPYPAPSGHTPGHPG